jgi:hypothetical protein
MKKMSCELKTDSVDGVAILAVSVPAVYAGGGGDDTDGLLSVQHHHFHLLRVNRNFGPWAHQNPFLIAACGALGSLQTTMLLPPLIQPVSIL